MEESEKKKYYEELNRKCKTEKGGLEKKQTLEQTLNKEKNTKERKEEEKMQNKWPKHAQENGDMSAL